ncbi:MAG TPA: toxin-antitoxin system HicB family antitoxin [Gaiellales bacterium]|nr:toxin-antitoxin system HicB family antitoxin [Gaiellales bacterium]
MELGGVITAIISDLDATARLGDQSLRDSAERLGHPMGSSIRVHLLDALGDLAADLNGQLPGGRVELRLSGGDVELVFVPDPERYAAVADDEHSARVTLRLPEPLKARAEAAASAAGVSTNSWLVRAVAARLEDGGGRRHARRLRGFAES